jgi:hypothetical protein
VTWEGTDAQRTELRNALDAVAKWAKENKRPVFLGEFGAYSKADMASRAKWTRAVAREAEARGFSWAYWEFAAGFGAYDKDKSGGASRCSRRSWRSELPTAYRHPTRRGSGNITCRSRALLRKNGRSEDVMM